MSYRWVYSEPERTEAVDLLQGDLGVPLQIARLLALRGVNTFDQARLFFRPGLDLLHDPFLMQDMEAAADRLSRAVRNNETVLVYGDYDVDGTTATASMLLFLREFGVNALYYIPHRFKEGYGINREGIQHAEEAGASLIVSVDCGITALEEAKLAKEKGIDLIICDHHTVGDEIPDAVAVLDPKRPDCSYPFDGLSGAGVAYKLISATVQRLGLPDTVASQYLDLVAISIASDIVPVVDENRVLMREGLKLIASGSRIGIKTLLELIKVDRSTISTSSIVFSVGPRINAAGRMGDAGIAVELLIADTENEAILRAQELDSINRDRRDLDARTMEEAMAMLEREYEMESISSMVLHDPGWHLGVIGIVASRLVDAHYRPAIMLSTVDGMIKGSARSIKGFNIYEALRKCEDLLVQYGGHEFAAGLTMEQEQLPEFRRRMDEIAGKDLSENDFQPELAVDAEISLDMVDAKFWKLLSQFEPFGPGNQRPIFVSRGVSVQGTPTIVGNGHLKMKLSQNGSATFDVIGFNMHDYMPLLRNPNGSRIDVAYMLEENFWKNRRSIQIHLKDIHLG
ncbi:MAG: single-stranded-DNA-specific exonuclease RecJ [Balneolaceae bacterium]